MQRDAEATRVDRISASAQSNKAQIYH